ncbi:MAG: hypothetical protein KGL75_06395 [Acidobacteriota bacterium]|nr:hypothetical protein [Acidobacteriota bacterium]
MSRVAAYTLAITAAMLMSSPAFAHHSFTMFDQSKTVTLKGTVKDFRWTNPHVFIQLLVKNDAGGEDEWSIEMTSPEHLSRAGWRPGTLKPGEEVTIVIHPLHSNEKGGEYLSGTGPTGPLLGAPPPGPGR